MVQKKLDWTRSLHFSIPYLKGPNIEFKTAQKKEPRVEPFTSLHDEHQLYLRTFQMNEPILDDSIHEGYQQKWPDDPEEKNKMNKLVKFKY